MTEAQARAIQPPEPGAERRAPGISEPARAGGDEAADRHRRQSKHLSEPDCDRLPLVGAAASRLHHRKGGEQEVLARRAVEEGRQSRSPADDVVDGDALGWGAAAVLENFTDVKRGATFRRQTGVDGLGLTGRAEGAGDAQEYRP